MSLGPWQHHAALVGSLLPWSLSPRSQHHKDFFPLDGGDYLGILLGIGSLLVAAGGGVGGGALLVPIFIVLFGSFLCVLHLHSGHGGLVRAGCCYQSGAMVDYMSVNIADGVPAFCVLIVAAGLPLRHAAKPVGAPDWPCRLWSRLTKPTLQLPLQHTKF